ncbi:alpha/beta hydrolase [Streptomyces sp. NPDC005283]|uniref:alpha/beta hydrolase n=1 Tax=Streptomyces sp. NPDC005283 TaxID=3156871 RepID=UPI003456B890
MITWEQLEKLNTKEYEDAADGWGKVSSRANAAKDRLDNEMLGKLRETQKGHTADAAIGDLARLSRNYQYIHTECGLIRTALNGLAGELAGPQKRLKDALAEAPKTFTVNPDGSVEYPVSPSFIKVPASGSGTASPGAPVPLLPGRAEGGSDANKALAEQIAENIATALREADEIDGRYAGILRKLKIPDGVKGLDITDAMFIDAARDTKDLQKAAKYREESEIPKDKSPAHNAEWWKGLSQEQRDEYTTLYPASIGALDGIPSTVRDDANRMVLAETRAKYQLELDALPPEPSKYVKHPGHGRTVRNEEWVKWNERKVELEKSLKGPDAIEKRLYGSASSGLPPAYLLGFDTEKRGHAIVSIGNPDTADNVVTYVPGTFAKLESIDGDLSRAELLRSQANATDREHSTTSILWLDYDAPQSILGEASDTKFADAAQQPLSNFLTGIQEANGGEVNQTLLGHSYGSLVAGQTMRDNGDLPVDNAIMVGSPGVGVDHAKDLNIPADHVWAGTAKNDLINLAPPPAGPLAPLNPKAYMELFDDHSIVHGNDPISDDFGGRTFHVADGKLPGSGGEMMPAHSQYWEGDSLNNMAKIVTGGQP